jgi:hypothetical protein
MLQSLRYLKYHFRVGYFQQLPPYPSHTFHILSNGETISFIVNPNDAIPHLYTHRVFCRGGTVQGEVQKPNVEISAKGRTK